MMDKVEFEKAKMEAADRLYMRKVIRDVRIDMRLRAKESCDGKPKKVRKNVR